MPAYALTWTQAGLLRSPQATIVEEYEPMVARAPRPLSKQEEELNEQVCAG